MRAFSRCIALLVAIALNGCTMGREYVRPDIKMPAKFYEDGGVTQSSGSESIANFPWWEQFNDATLSSLISEALKNNYDVKTAAARIEEASAIITGARALALPQIGVGVSGQPTVKQSGQSTLTNYTGVFTFGWEIDLWGRYRRSIEAAQANFQASEAARDAVTAGLVASVARNYFQLESLEQVLKITQDTIRAQKESLVLIKRLAGAGVSSQTQVQQTINLVETTESTLPIVKTNLAQTQSALSVLLGRAPGQIRVGEKFSADLFLKVPVGLPSELLMRRPDVRQAEAQLIAANANFGQAKAMFFPSFSLTGTLGYASTALGDLLSGGAASIVSPGISLLQPLFQGGTLLSNERAAKARLKQADYNYRKTVLVALRDVSDSLVAFKESADEINAQSRRELAARESLRLTTMSYRAGVSSYLDVLDSQRQLFAAAIDLSNAQLRHNSAAVAIYLALGGGWQTVPNT